MLSPSPAVRVFLALDPVDMRGSYNSLSGVVRRLGLDPLDGHVYVFLNRKRFMAALLWYDGSGWCVTKKRLSRGTFQLPPHGAAGGRLRIDAASIVGEGGMSALQSTPGFRDGVWLGESGSKPPFGPKGMAENTVKMTLEFAGDITPQEHIGATKLREWRRSFAKAVGDFSSEAEWMAAREGHMWTKAKEHVRKSEHDILSIKNPGGKGTFIVLKQGALSRLKPTVTRLAGKGAQHAVAELSKQASRSFWSQGDEAVSSAAKTKWGKAARYLKYGGRSLVVVGAAVDIYDLYSSGFNTRTVSGKVGGWVGAAAGAWAGGKIGAAGGAGLGVWAAGAGAAPGAAIGGTLGAIAGGIGGYIGGEQLAQTAYDAFFERGYQLSPAY